MVLYSNIQGPLAILQGPIYFPPTHYLHPTIAPILYNILCNRPWEGFLAILLKREFLSGGRTSSEGRHLPLSLSGIDSRTFYVFQGGYFRDIAALFWIGYVLYVFDQMLLPKGAHRQCFFVFW